MWCGAVWCGVVWFGVVRCGVGHLSIKRRLCPVAGPTVSLLRGPPPEVAQQADSTLSVVCEASSTEPTLEIQWYYISTEGLKIPVKTLSSVVQNLPFTINTRLFLRANILTTVTSTLTIERLSAAYVGGYACTAAAGDIQVDSNVCQVHVQVRMGLRYGCLRCRYASQVLGMVPLVQSETKLWCTTVQHSHA